MRGSIHVKKSLGDLNERKMTLKKLLFALISQRNSLSLLKRNSARVSKKRNVIVPGCYRELRVEVKSTIRHRPMLPPQSSIHIEMVAKTPEKYSRTSSTHQGVTTFLSTACAAGI